MVAQSTATIHAHKYPTSHPSKSNPRLGANTTPKQSNTEHNKTKQRKMHPQMEATPKAPGTINPIEATPCLYMGDGLEHARAKSETLLQ